MNRTTVLALSLLLTACKGSRVSSEDEAELAYLGLDVAIERALNLGMQGYAEADSANIPDQTEDGDVSGTMTVGGQVDQGASANKGMRLDLVLFDYADIVDVDEDDDSEVEITYDTDDSELPGLDLSLRDIPDGTFTGTLDGIFVMQGDLEGEVTLFLEMDGEIETDPSVTGGIRRVSGTTAITGTATSGGGSTFDVDIVR